MERENLINLVQRVQNGDSEAINVLFETYYNDVYFFAIKTVNNPDNACDATQNTFLEIIQTINSLREPAAFVTWMKRITYHQCLRFFSQNREVQVEEDEDGNTIFDQLADASEEVMPSEVLEQAEFKKTILAMVDSLTEDQRSAVMLYYYDELPVKHIAYIQGVSEGTVKSRLNYARKALKKCVEDYEKKNNMKLHVFGVLPLFLLFFSKELMPEAKVHTVRSNVMASAHTIASDNSTSMSAAKNRSFVATSSGTTSPSAFGSLFSKIAKLPLVSKLMVCALSIVLAIGIAAVIHNVATPSALQKSQQESATQPSNSGTQEDNHSEKYESELLKLYLPSLVYQDIFVEYASSNPSYIRTVDGNFVSIHSPLESPYPDESLDAQDQLILGAHPSYFDSFGTLHTLDSDGIWCPCPQLPGTVLYTGSWRNSRTGETGVYTQSIDTEGYLYEYHFNMHGLSDAVKSNGRVGIEDHDTKERIDKFEEYVTLSILRKDGTHTSANRYVVNDVIYEHSDKSNTIHLDETTRYYSAINTGVNRSDLLNDLSDPYLIYKSSSPTLIYIADDLVSLPDEKNADQISFALGGPISVIIFNDGSVYLYGWGWKQDLATPDYSEELSKLNQAGKIKHILHAPPSIFFVMDDNLTYYISYEIPNRTN